MNEYVHVCDLDGFILDI